MVDVDFDEYVEVPGPAGTDLTGWKLEFTMVIMTLS